MRTKKTLKLFFLCLCSVFCAIAISRFCHKQTAGFKVGKIRSNLLNTSSVHPSSQEDKQFLQTLFRQKFTYLGRGLQSFAFLSEDGKYVLKIFNNRYSSKIDCFSLLSHLPFFNEWAIGRKQYYQKKWEQTHQSYELAYEEMQNLTGLVCLHLHPTSDLPPIAILIDKLNIAHPIDPNQTGFLIQKKASLVFPTLKELIAQGNTEGAQQAIRSLINLFLWKSEHNILDNDPLIRTNYGYVDGKAVQIDVGPLSKSPTPLSSEYSTKEIRRVTSSLKFWLTENAPELVPFLDRELEHPLSSKG